MKPTAEAAAQRLHLYSHDFSHACHDFTPLGCYETGVYSCNMGVQNHLHVRITQVPGGYYAETIDCVHKDGTAICQATGWISIGRVVGFSCRQRHHRYRHRRQHDEDDELRFQRTKSIDGCRHRSRSD